MTFEVADPDRLTNYIPTNLRVLRKEAGWSQTDLAHRVGLNRGNIASYESGNAEPSICKLLRVGKLFGVRTRDLTRRDLREPAELALARGNYSPTVGDADRYATHREHHRQLGHLLAASHRLFEHKRSQLEPPCREAELISAQYLQLLDLSNQLLDRHGKLLDELSCARD